MRASNRSYSDYCSTSEQLSAYPSKCSSAWTAINHGSRTCRDLAIDREVSGGRTRGDALESQSSISSAGYYHQIADAPLSSNSRILQRNLMAAPGVTDEPSGPTTLEIGPPPSAPIARLTLSPQAQSVGNSWKRQLTFRSLSQSG
jgi:hypothetical protein